LFINLTPCIPLSLRRRGGRDFREGLRPSLTYTPPSLVKGRGQEDKLLNDLQTVEYLQIGILWRIIDNRF
jgi:hypothetical protein